MNMIFISGGRIDSDFALDFIKKHNEDTIVAIDRGLQFCSKKGIRPHYIVGDFDSLSPGILENYESDPDIYIRHLKPEKDDSDTESAFHLALDMGADTIYLLGATGSRMDHMMANLQLLVYGVQKGVLIYLIDPNNKITALTRSVTLKKAEQYGNYVSFFSWGDEVTDFTLKGFKYPLNHYHLTNTSCGLSLSNEIAEDQAEVHFESGVLLMIQSKD